MKKMKKLLALLVAMTMVLGMAMTVSAAPSTAASITIHGLTENDNTNIKVYPVVLWNSEENAWSIQSWAEGKVTIEGDGAPSANWAGLKEASASATTVYDRTVNSKDVTISGLDIGLYLVLANGDKTTYEVMGFQTFEYDATDHLIGPLAADVYAKGEGYPLEKTFSDGDKEVIVGYGDTVSYDIKAIFPSFAKGSTGKVYWIEDEPDGLSIQSIAVKVNDEVLIESVDYTLSTTVPAAKDENVTVTFTEDFIGDENAHAGQDVVVTVTARVETAGTYTNTPNSNKDKDENPTVSRDTGSMLLTKKNEDQETLTGAKFKFYDSSDTLLKFVATETDNEYRLYDEILDAAVSTDRVLDELEVGTTGWLKITGLAEGTYKIVETKAPDGYAIGDDVKKTIDYVADPDAQIGEDNTVHLDFDIVNTKLASLPSTGGIGTTIFTIGGCGIMIAAAALYFVNKRKSEEN